MRRFLAFWFAALVLLWVPPLPAHAAGGCTASLDRSGGSPGSYVQLSIRYNGAQGVLGALELHIGFDGEAFEFSGLSRSAYLPDVYQAHRLDAAGLRVIYVAKNGAGLGSGELASCRLRVRENAPVGSSDIRFQVVSALTAGAQELLCRYAWPGNVRELRNICERLVVLSDAADVTARDLRELHSFSCGAVPAAHPPAKTKKEQAKELGVTPMATWIAGALAGVRPEVMGIGPVAATKKVMAKTGYKIEDFDIIEANEAFAAQSVAVGKDLGIDVDKQLNPNGGAIALGHPVGASGCRILVTLLHEMQAKGAKKGLATLCIGGGMGCSTIVEM